MKRDPGFQGKQRILLRLQLHEHGALMRLLTPRVANLPALRYRLSAIDAPPRPRLPERAERQYRPCGYSEGTKEGGEVKCTYTLKSSVCVYAWAAR